MSDIIHTQSLKEPVTVGSETVTELKFKKPKAKHLKALRLGNADMSDMLTIVSRLTGQPSTVVEELSWEDALEAVAFVGKFLPAGPETGEKPLA